MKKLVLLLIVMAMAVAAAPAGAYSLWHAENFMVLSEAITKFADSYETCYTVMQSCLENDVVLAPIEISTYKQTAKTYLDSGILALQMGSGYYFHIMKEASLTTDTIADAMITSSDITTGALQRTADEALAKIDEALEDSILTETEEKSIEETMGKYINVVSTQIDTYLEGLG